MNGMAAIPVANRQPLHRRRPLGVTLLALGVLSITGLSVVRFTGSLLQWDFLAQVLPITPLYLLLTGAAAALLGLPLSWGLWRGARWAPGLARLAAVAGAALEWFDRLVLAAPPARLNWPFAAVLQAVILVWIFWMLSRSTSMVFFGESYGD